MPAGGHPRTGCGLAGCEGGAWIAARVAETISQRSTPAPASRSSSGIRTIRGKYYYNPGLQGFNFERRMMKLIDALDCDPGGARSARGADRSMSGPCPPATVFRASRRQNPLPLPDSGAGPRIWLGTRGQHLEPLRYFRQPRLCHRRAAPLHALRAGADRQALCRTHRQHHVGAAGEPRRLRAAR